MRKPTRKAGAIVTVIAFAFSASALADPLAAGKPAGVRAAQDVGNKELLVFAGVGAVLAGVLIATAGAGEHPPGQPPSVPVITTTT